MSKFRLKVNYRSSKFSRYLPRIQKGISTILILLLTFVTTYVMSTRITSIIKKTINLNTEIVQLRNEVTLTYNNFQKLEEVDVQAFNWLPVNSIPNFQVCENDMDVYQRIIKMGLEKKIDLIDLSVQTQEEIPVGYAYRFQLNASFASIVEFLKGIELEFVVFEIKTVHLKPEIAEDTYMDKVHLYLEGWLL